MYNRYIRNDRGVYTRIPEDSPDPRPSPPPVGGPSSAQPAPGGNRTYTSFPGGGQNRPPSPGGGGGQANPQPPPAGAGQPEPQSSSGGPFDPPPFFEAGQSYAPPPGGDAFRDAAAKGRQIKDSVTDFLRRTLDRLNLDHVDTGDLLLLLLLFLLFQEDADEELMIALGLLLIL